MGLEINAMGRRSLPRGRAAAGVAGAAATGLLTAVWLLAVVGPATVAAEDDRPPNILFLSFDDLNPADGGAPRPAMVSGGRVLPAALSVCGAGQVV